MKSTIDERLAVLEKQANSEFVTMSDLTSITQELDEIDPIPQPAELPEDVKMYIPDISEAPAGKIFKTSIRKVIVEAINFDEECREDFIKGKAIIINDPDSFDKKNNKNPHGLQSGWFGTDYGDDAAFNDRYRCECGKYIGKMHLGCICDECNTPVQQCETDLTKFGWIMLDKYQIMHPLYYQKLDNALGSVKGLQESVLSCITNVVYHDKNQTADLGDIKMQEIMEKNPFMRKGMIWLSEHLLEVLDFYSKKKSNDPKKKAKFDELYNNIDKIFCHAVPVYNSTLRLETPGNKGEKFFKVKVNSLWGSIIKDFNKINDYFSDNPTFMDEIEINKFLRTAQTELQAIFDEEFAVIDGKKGVILGKVISGRVNYSSRLIIKAGSGILHADEVELPYVTFLDFFDRELMTEYSHIKGCSLKVAQAAWNRAHVHFDREYYAIMMWMIKDPRNLPYIHIMINRNPSINFGSFLTVKIAAINPNVSDKTMTINTRIIKTMAADFDGDQLNVFRIQGANLGSKFELNMNPKYNLYISKTNGRVNPAMMPTKNETVGFFQFNNFGVDTPMLFDIVEAAKSGNKVKIRGKDAIEEVLRYHTKSE